MNSQKTRIWTFRLLAVIAGLLPIVVAEVALRMFDLPVRSPAADPFVDLHNLRPLFEVSKGDPDSLQIGPSRLNLFRPASFKKTKPPGLWRVFALGGSTTQGEPFSTETAFPAWLQLSLQCAMPDQQVEVINCGGLSYASYRVLAILREVLQYDPDLIVVYTGHNEFLEKRSYAGFDQSSWKAQTSSWLVSLRLVQACKNVTGRHGRRPDPAVANPTRLADEVDALLDYRGGLSDYHRDHQFAEAVASHFRWNLNEMVSLCQTNAIPLILIKPVSNVLDCPPFKILPDPEFSDEELQRFEATWESAKQATSTPNAVLQGKAALAMDPRHAGANYLVGRLLHENGSPDEALPYLTRARDFDVCPLRAPTQLERIVEEVAKAHGVIYVDARDALTGNDEAMGSKWLVDHIHPSIAGHQRIGRELARACFAAGVVSVSNASWQSNADVLFEKHLASLGEEYFQRGKQRLEGLILWTQGRAKKIRPQQSE